ncbi:hypothetical protein ACGFW5_33380 [Streptomyces sp. NPDC048416]|uniref:hypothetical protein n=1 Tax=Streptomyces sp. NPDC048416 TaxID=3365546 RepID=UPI0037189342
MTLGGASTSFFATNAMLASRHIGLSIHDPGCLRAVTAYALVVPVCALIGPAWGAVLRHATASIVAVVSMLFILPLLFGGERYRFLKEIGNHLPLAAESRLALNPGSHTGLGGVWWIRVGQGAAPGAVHRKAPERRDSGAIGAFRQRREVPCQAPHPRP